MFKINMKKKKKTRMTTSVKAKLGKLVKHTKFNRQIDYSFGITETRTIMPMNAKLTDYTDK